MNNPKPAEEYEKRKRINKDNTKILEALMKNYIEGNNYQRMDYRESNKDNPNYLINSGMVNANENSYSCPFNSVYNSLSNGSMLPYFRFNQNQVSLIPNDYSNCIYNLILNDELNPSLSYSDMVNAYENSYSGQFNSAYNSLSNGSMLPYFRFNQNQDSFIFNCYLNSIGNNYLSQEYSNYDSFLNGSMITNYGCYQNQSNLIINNCSNSINNLNKESNSSLKNCDNINSNIVSINKNETYEDLSSTGCIAECNIDFILLVLGKGRLIEPIKIDMEKEVTYDYKKKSFKGKKKEEITNHNCKEGKVKLILNFKSINRVFPNLSLLVVEQTNTNIRKAKKGFKKNEEPIKVCIENKEKVEVILKTNQGENKYVTKLSFMEGKNAKLIINNLKTKTTKAFWESCKKNNVLKLKENGINCYKNQMKLILIDKLKMEGGMNNLQEIINIILDSYEFKKMKNLEKSIKEKFKKLEKNEEFKKLEKNEKELIKEFQEKRPSKEKRESVKKIKSIFNFIFRSNKLELYISCFELIYKCIIDKIINTDCSIIGYFDQNILNFIKNFNTGFCNYNIVIIVKSIKRRLDLEENEVEDRRKQQKKNNANKIVHDKPINNSDSGKFIS
jgi:hypothetical protein